MTPPLLHVHIPGGYRFCNYRCSYCYLPAFAPAITPDVVSSITRVVSHLDRLARPLHVIFATDGEISVAKALWPVLRQVTNLPATRLISMFSNCSGPMDQLLEQTDPARLALIATCHLEQLPSDAAVTKFISTVAAVRPRVRSLVTSVMLAPDVLPRYPAFKREMDDRGLPVFAYPPFVVRGYPRPSTAEEHALVRRILADTNPAPVVNEFIMGATLPDVRCAAGRDYIEIGTDGAIVDCWRHRRSLGNLFSSPAPSLRTDDMVCPSGGCGSNWPVGFTDVVRRDFRRVDSLYHFVTRDTAPATAESFEITT